MREHTYVFCTYCAEGVRTELTLHVIYQNNQNGELQKNEVYEIVTYWYHKKEISNYKYETLNEARTTYLAMVSSLISTNNKFLDKNSNTGQNAGDSAE